LVTVLGSMLIYNFYMSLSKISKFVFWTVVPLSLITGLAFIWDRYSKAGRERRKRIETITEIPRQLLLPDKDCIFMGTDSNLNIPVYLPDSIRSRHVHIVG